MKSLVEDLLEANRIQRHDFLNNIQVIWGLIKINKQDKAVEYIAEVTSHLQALRKTNQITQPEIEAMMLSRVMEIGINPGFKYSISENWRVKEEIVPEVNALISSIWNEIKTPLDQEKINVDFCLEESKILIKVNTIDTEASLSWNAVFDLCKKNNFHYIELKNEIIINL
ncbi:Sensor_kinase_SpoOB-type, alpha-helical domain [Desulfonispora thiosulfatigenes DSM 11270]|uniref:Sensor_kinase_SpoOB-type, alpha-helical domain n=1 Tax=Desulfonispora thiosulfatigenes DSM 11270 TaxID=656914 RepID=A0A1W1UH46_DESTI|nr:Spo0B domain-containing protein [Desulfonispora thiosulfatigenes]SMB80359.1 Sensor_kinase_SpoOB-type, alpha-helical domain [Desulfonispora thiosulfatigenes DSM 11270]